MSIQLDMSESIGVEQSSSSIVILINNKLDTTPLSFPKETIFKVHALLRTENEMAYEPEIVAIGPYHRGKDRLQVMEGKKLCWFKLSLEHRGQRDATKYVEAVKRLEPEARQCYSESTENMNEDEFVEMLLLDACFIIQFICRFLSYNSGATDPFFHDMLLFENPKDPFFRDWVLHSLMRDMLLFENQIPLFMLQEFFDKIKLPQDPTHFHELAVRFLTQLLQEEFKLSITGSALSSSHENNSEHMLGLLHYILRSVAVTDCRARLMMTKDKWTSRLRETKGFEFINKKLRSWGWSDQKDTKKINHDELKSESMPSVAKLHAAGVEFRSKNVEGGPFEIKFENGVMEIPTFTIHDGTESLYRNLIAYEQYNQEARNRYVSRYAMLMDCLIDTAEDVALLRSSGVVGNALGHDEAVSSVFNKLASQVSVSNVGSTWQVKLFEDVNAYYDKRRHRWMATLKSDYFNSPWALISFLAALFLLQLTLIQTVFSVLGGV